MRSEIRQWFASHPWALNAAFTLMFVSVVYTGGIITPLEAGTAGGGP